MNISDGRSIQIDNGEFTRVHNAIFEKLAYMPLSSRQFRCLMFLFRKTYGFNRKADRISFSQWEKGTGLKRANVWHTLQTLLKAKIIYADSPGPNRVLTWGFNKYYEQWNLDEETVIPSDIETVIPGDNESVIDGDNSSANDAGQSVIEGDNETVIPGDNNKRQKTVEEAAAPAIPVSEPTTYQQFVTAYEEAWGRMIANPTESEIIEDWSQRVLLEGWKYALKESAKNRATHFSYLEKILLRIEREGYQPANASPPTAPAQVAYSLEELCLT